MPPKKNNKNKDKTDNDGGSSKEKKGGNSVKVCSRLYAFVICKLYHFKYNN